MAEEQQYQEGQEQQPETVEDQLRQLLAGQEEYRKEVAALRSDIAQSRANVAAPPQSANAPSPEEAAATRMAQVEQFPYYCHVCGRLYKRETECRGTAVAPHPPVEVVSTDELKQGDTSLHTPAPSTAT